MFKKLTEITNIMKYTHIILALLAVAIIWFFSMTPSNNREWSPDQATLPYAQIEGNLIHVYNIRNITYRSTTDYTIHYYNKTYDLNKLDSVWYVMEPFSLWQPAAHGLVSFGFGNEYLAISAEIRKEKGETFSPIRGLLRQYELMYVIGDEQDLIKLRSNYRNHTVYLYPINSPSERTRQMLISMLNRTNKLKEHPEFYNTLTNSCTSNIAKHVNEVIPGRVPFSWKTLLPAYSDEYAYDLGLISNELPFKETREKYKINEKALKYADDPEFSTKIRE